MKIRSLKFTILATFIAVTFVNCILLFFIAVKFSRRTVRSITKDDIYVIADRIDDTISEVIQEKFNFLDYTGNMTALRDENVDLQAKCALVMPMASNKEKDLLSLSFLSPNGDTALGPNIIVNFASAPIVQKIMKSPKTILAGPSKDTVTNMLSINIASPVYTKSNQVAGFLLARLNCNFLSEISSRIHIGNSGYAIFIDRETGNTIGSLNQSDIDNNQNLLKIAQEGNYSDLEENMTKLMKGEHDCGYFTIDGVERIMVYKPIKNTNWSVAVMAEESEFIGKLGSMEKLLFTLTVVLLLVSLIAAYFITRSLSPLKKVGEAISEISTGNADLTQRIEIKRGKQEIVDIVEGFNSFVTKLQEIITSVKDSENRLVNADDSLQCGTQDTSAAITQINANIQSVYNQITSQAGSVEETAGAVNEIASNIESLEHMIQKQSEGVSQASSAVEEMIGNINSVNKSADIMFNSFKELQEKTNVGIKTQSGVNEIIQEIENQSKMLQDANSAIASIASQTNLLAMNAAIEAAHAGESGKGFSVVADEIRKLSETSTGQSKTIGEELKKIQESIHSVVQASSDATAVFTSVSESIQNTDELVGHIKAAMEEQQTGSKQITDALYAMNDSTVEVKSASSEMAEGNKHILLQINNLQNVTSMIKDSITEMSDGAQKIYETGTALTGVSKEVTNSIESIKNEIDQFKV